jgi:hypothetical protein
MAHPCSHRTSWRTISKPGPDGGKRKPTRTSPRNHGTTCKDRLVKPSLPRTCTNRPASFLSAPCLGNPCLQALAELLHMAELVSNYPLHVRGALVPLIDRPDGGLRPTTLFRAVYRLHAQPRASIVRCWARTLHRPAINMAEHRQVLDGTFRLMVRQHTMQRGNSNKAIADLIWDLRKAFENVLRATL